MFPCSSSSSSRVEVSNPIKYGSSSCSVSLRGDGGKRWAMPGGRETSGVAFSLDEEAGIGRYACAGVGLAGSSGGAFRLFFGIDETGCECKTSFWIHLHQFCLFKKGTVLTQLTLGSRNLHQTPSSRISFILRHLFRNTASMRLRSSIIVVSSFAFVGFAA